MSERSENMGDESHDEIIAGEYVLGVLSLEDRRRVESRIAGDHLFATRVRRWQDNLESLDESYGEERPPHAAFTSIEARLFGEAKPQRTGVFASLWDSVAVWRGLTLASVVMSAGFAVTTIALNRPLPLPKPLLAEMSAEGSAFKLVAAYDSNSGRLRVSPAAASVNEPKSLELWLIDGDLPATSLGVMPASGEGELLVPADLRARISEGKTLAVSLEPLGGSPTGVATGPILAVGKTSY